MYNASLKYKWDNKNVRDYAAEKGREEGRKEERAKALEEKKNIARSLIKKKIDLEVIAEATGLSIEEIKAL